LEDVDWRGGELVVTGKGDRSERMPLPHDVGAAIAAYLEHGRPAPVDGARQVFLRVRAPHRALTARGVDAIVRDAAARAGIAPVTGHRLRHTVAGQLLAAGASLPEIGQVLRHRRQLTTAIYAKVDIDALRPLARPWPGSMP
jgi:site-specific recombinase XerD